MLCRGPWLVQVGLLMLSSCLRLCHLSADVLLRIRDRYDGGSSRATCQGVFGERS